MNGQLATSSPRPHARLAGLFYLLTFVTAGAASVASGKLIVSSDAAATAAGILVHESAYRVGFAADILVIASYIAVTALFYHLFKPVSKVVSLLAALFSLMGCALQCVSALFVLAPFVILKGAKYLGVFNQEQLQALTMLLLQLSSQAYAVDLIFFGFYCVLIGILVFRSTFLPRTLGVLMAIGGLAWLTFIWPPLARHLSPYILVPGIVGEGSLTLWLLIKGVNTARWRHMAGATHEDIVGTLVKQPGSA